MTNATRNITTMTKRRPRIHMILLETPEGISFCKSAYPAGRLMLARRLAYPVGNGWRVYGEVLETSDGYRASVPVYGLRTFHPPYTIEVNGYTYCMAWVYTEETTIKATAQNG